MVRCCCVHTVKNLLVKEGKKKEKTDNPVKNLLILRMFFRLSLRISAEALKISEFTITALLSPFLKTKSFDIKKAIKKEDSRKIAAGCLGRLNRAL